MTTAYVNREMAEILFEELVWAVKRDVDGATAAAAFRELARETRGFLRNVEVARTRGTGSRWGEIEDALGRLHPAAFTLASKTFRDGDVATWLIQQKDHIPDATNYLQYLLNIAERSELIAS